jgi:signal transduction histidine kinase/CheY-like chemotaxis protein
VSSHPPDELISAFVRLAKGDFSVRLVRNFQRDEADTLAFFVNLIAEELDRLFQERERQKKELDRAIAELSEKFRAVAAGDFAARATRTEKGDATDVLAGLFNNTVAELGRAQARLRMTDRLTAMGTVAAGVAHEINNPLAFVIGNLDFVTEQLATAGGGLPAQQRDELDKALKAAQLGAERVRQIVGDLKRLSRSDADEATVVRLELSRVLDTSVMMIKNEVRHHARLVKEYGDCPAVEGNETRLGQVFLNLLQNAAQAIPEGQVEHHVIRVVTATSPSGQAVVEVHDTGCGIPPANLARVFDTFFTTKPVGTGTGLGLSLCHQVVTEMGGRIDVESEVDKGSVFRVVLPAAAAVVGAEATRPPAMAAIPATAPAPPGPAPVGMPALAAAAPIAAAPTAPAPAGGATSARAGRRRVLVVDDELEVGLAIRRLLGREHDVDAVTRGTHALERVRTKRYDLVLCDLQMPEMTGMDLHAHLLDADRQVAERMVFMTAGAFSSGAREFLERVPNRRIEKPFTLEVLRELLLLGAPTASPRTP